MVEGGGEDKASVRAPAVFISYASQDAAAAARICSALRQAGVEVWFDQSQLRGGDVWDQRIRREIRDCTLFMPVISANTASRHEGYFRLEWDLADQRTHMMARDRAFIVPVCLDATKEAGTDVPESFHRVQWTRLLDGNTPPAFTARIVALLGAPGAAASAAESTHSTEKTGHGAPRALTLTVTAKSTLRKNRLAIAVTAAIMIMLAYVAIDRLWLSKHTSAEKPAAAVAPAPTSAIPEKSVAVLPFADMSEKKDQEYFADGMAEELIDMLTKIPDLRVPARTSSFSFKGKQATIADIAKALSVAHVLEGSVRKSGRTLRITAQLVRVDSGYHLWSETYDRNVEDIFKVQDEIAAAVVEALKARLLPGQGVVNQHRTEKLEAYREYLLGNQLRARDTTDSNRQALEAYRKAAALDPGYAAAQSGLAVSEWRVADQTTGETAAYQRAAAAADKAISLAPASPDGYWARGTLRYLNFYDWSGAQADFNRALALDANDVPTLVYYARLLATLGRTPDAIAMTRKAIALDPLSAEAWYWLSYYLICSGQMSEARESVKRILDAKPDADEVVWQFELFANGPQAALAALPQHFPESALYGMAVAQHSLGHAAESQRALDVLIRDRADAWAYQIATVYAWRGESAQAIEWLERAYRQQDAGMTRLTLDRLLAKLRGDLRFKALVRKMNLPE